MSGDRGATNTVHVKYRKIHRSDLKYDDKVGTMIHCWGGTFGLSPASVPGARDVRRRAEGYVAGQECSCQDVPVCREKGRLL